MANVIQKIRLVSAEEGADDLLVKAAKIALEEARRFGIREAIDPDDSEEVYEARTREWEYARGIGFYWQEIEHHIAVLETGEHIHLRGIKGRTITQAKVELEVVVTSKIAECPW
jgi:hypothetical protein